MFSFAWRLVNGENEIRNRESMDQFINKLIWFQSNGYKSMYTNRQRSLIWAAISFSRSTLSWLLFLYATGIETNYMICVRSIFAWRMMNWLSFVCYWFARKVAPFMAHSIFFLFVGFSVAPLHTSSCFSHFTIKIICADSSNHK